VHADGKSEPVEEVRERIEDFEFPYGKEGRAAKDDAEKSVREERPHADKELGGKILTLLVNDIACRVSEPKEADVENVQLEEAAEKEVTGFMNDDAGECQGSDHGAGNEEHAICSLFGGTFAAAEKIVVLLFGDDLSRTKPILNSRNVFVDGFKGLGIALRELAGLIHHFLGTLSEIDRACDCVFARERTCELGSSLRGGLFLPLILRNCQERIKIAALKCGASIE